MTGKICAILMLILLTPVYAIAQDEADPALFEDWLMLGMEMWEDFWETDYDLSYTEMPCIDMESLDSVLLDVCLDLDISDEDMFEMFPELYEPDYEFYMLWEDDMDY
jgi:hypothetical protein